jgi:CRP-like cAMP-binding protein
MESPLARFGWLPHVDADFRSFVLQNLQIREVPSGRTITHAGDDMGGLYALVDGQIAFLATLGVNAGVINYMGYPGSWWGQAPLVGLPRVGHTIARTDCRIALLPLPLLRQHLAQAPQHWQSMALTYSDLFMQAAGAHADLLIAGHLRRLVATLLRLGGNRHRRFPVDAPDTFLATQEELATAIGLARNATGRLLRRLEGDGLIDAGYGRVRFLDRPRLARLANSDDTAE